MCNLYKINQKNIGAMLIHFVLCGSDCTKRKQLNQNVSLRGLEPLTSSMSMKRSNQLSYRLLQTCRKDYNLRLKNIQDIKAEIN